MMDHVDDVGGKLLALADDFYANTFFVKAGELAAQVKAQQLHQFFDTLATGRRQFSDEKL